jgi:choline dehydrogenase
VTLRSVDPRHEPRIEHCYISDPEGHDRKILADGVRIARVWTAQSGLREVLGDELAPGNDIRDEAAVERWIDNTVTHYYHPVGTCAMGVESDLGAVTDARGRIHGLDNAFVADCSIIPVIPRANTNVPAVVIGERIASWLLEN